MDGVNGGLFDLTGKVCVVTGSTKGIGLAMVRRMAEHGARVVVSSRHREEAEAVAQQLRDRHGADRALAVAFDLRDRSTYGGLVARPFDEWGRVDTLVCNAVSSSTYGPLGDRSAEQISQVMNDNVVANADICSRAAPIMASQGGGSLIIVLSSLAVVASPPYLSYSMGKAALKHMTSILAVDLGPKRVRVNAICPGIIRTAATVGITSSEELTRIAVGNTPLQRVGEPDEIAACAVFLASPGGSYITGQTIIADGGQTLQGMEGARRLVEGADWKAERGAS